MDLGRKLAEHLVVSAASNPRSTSLGRYCHAAFARQIWSTIPLKIWPGVDRARPRQARACCSCASIAATFVFTPPISDSNLRERTLQLGTGFTDRCCVPASLGGPLVRPRHRPEPLRFERFGILLPVFCIREIGLRGGLFILGQRYVGLMAMKPSKPIMLTASASGCGEQWRSGGHAKNKVEQDD